VANTVELPFLPAWAFTVGVFIVVDVLDVTPWLGALMSAAIIGIGYYLMHKAMRARRLPR
jgi:hypothetical protein